MKANKMGSKYIGLVIMIPSPNRAGTCHGMLHKQHPGWQQGRAWAALTVPWKHLFPLQTSIIPDLTKYNEKKPGRSLAQPMP